MLRSIRNTGGRAGRAVFNPRNPLWYVLHLTIFLLGVIAALLGDEWLQAVGASLVAAAIAGVVIYVYVARSERIERALDNYSEFGLLQVFDGRSVRIREEYDRRCERARDQLDILGFGLSSLVQDHRDDFPDWKRNANVRILAIDPDYPSAGQAYADQRDREERNEQGRIRADVQNLYDALGPLVGRENDKTFDVRLYRCLPSINIFRIDNEMLWGPYFMNEPSRNTPTFLIRRGGVLFDRIMEHFNAIWDDGELSVPLSDYDELGGRTT